MKTSLFSLAFTVGLTALAAAEVRTWTSADDASKTFEGEFVALKGETVTIRRADGKVLSFVQTKLSQADVDFIREQAAAQPEAEKTAEATEDKSAGSAAKGEESPMAQAFKGKTVKLEGKQLKKIDPATAKQPDYFLIYWGASWCGPCQAAAPDLVRLYNGKLDKSPKVELMHVSCDRDEDGMKSFMGKHKMKFPAVSAEDAATIQLLRPLSPSGIPSYKLVDAKGNLIAEGPEAKKKAAELARGGKATASLKD